MSGPYALEAFGDAIFFGDVDIGSTEFAPLLTTSYQKAYGNIYSTHEPMSILDLCERHRNAAAERRRRSTRFSQKGLLPETALFDSTTPVVTIPNDRRCRPS